ncbi:MAG: esterase [Microbacteriaceae bacterium]|nr:esterase [Microbacteriaceae bacterium]
MTSISRSVLSPDWSSHAADAPAVVVLLHGYGSHEHDLAGLVPALGLTMPWASLRAPLEAGNGGAAWFTILNPGDPAPEPVEQATDAVWAWLDGQVDSTTRVIPIGFSQGGLMATQLLRTRPERVLAPVVLGGFVLGTPQPADERLATERPAAFWGRGTDDRVITAAAVERTAAFLPGHTTLTERVYPGLTHSIHAEEIADVVAFLGANTESL